MAGRPINKKKKKTIVSFFSFDKEAEEGGLVVCRRWLAFSSRVVSLPNHVLGAESPWPEGRSRKRERKRSSPFFFM
jgi:hypothetical protein